MKTKAAPKQTKKRETKAEREKRYEKEQELFVAEMRLMGIAAIVDQLGEYPSAMKKERDNLKIIVETIERKFGTTSADEIAARFSRLNDELLAALDNMNKYAELLERRG